MARTSFGLSTTQMVLLSRLVSGFSRAQFISLIPYSRLALPVVLVYLAVGLLVGVLGSLIANRKYLQV